MGGIKSPRGNAELHVHLQHYQWLQTDVLYILVEIVNGQNRVHRFKIHKERNASNGLLIL